MGRKKKNENKNRDGGSKSDTAKDPAPPKKDNSEPKLVEETREKLSQLSVTDNSKQQPQQHAVRDQKKKQEQPRNQQVQPQSQDAWGQQKNPEQPQNQPQSQGAWGQQKSPEQPREKRDQPQSQGAWGQQKNTEQPQNQRAQPQSQGVWGQQKIPKQPRETRDQPQSQGARGQQKNPKQPRNQRDQPQSQGAWGQQENLEQSRNQRDESQSQGAWVQQKKQSKSQKQQERPQSQESGLQRIQQDQPQSQVQWGQQMKQGRSQKKDKRPQSHGAEVQQMKQNQPQSQEAWGEQKNQGGYQKQQKQPQSETAEDQQMKQKQIQSQKTWGQPHQKSTQDQEQQQKVAASQQKQQKAEKSSPGKVIESSMPHLLCPYKGAGTIGKRVGRIEVNYLKLNIDKMIDIAYHYDVTIDPDMPKKNLTNIFIEFCEKNFPTISIAFDGRKSAYAPRRLDLTNIQRKVDFEDPETKNVRVYMVAIQEAHDTAISLSLLRGYDQRRQYDIPMRAIQCLDVVLKGAFQQKHLKGVQAGRSFFLRPEGKRDYLGDYFELWRGLFQSIVLGRVPYLNVDVAHKAFPKPYNSMIDLIIDANRECRGGDINRPLSEQVCHTLVQHLRGLSICYSTPGTDSKKSYKFMGLDKVPANCYFVHEDQQMSVLKYFQSRFGRNIIQFPHLPCIKLGNSIRNISVPIEFCSILDSQALNKKFTENQTRELIKKAATSTDVRKENIFNLLRQIDHNRARTVNEFHLSVDNKFAEVSPRILEPPVIKYANSTLKPRAGVWRGEGMSFLKPEAAAVWGVLNSNYRTSRNEVKELCESLLRCSVPTKLQLAAQPAFVSDVNDRANDKEITKILNDIKAKKASIVFVIIPDFGGIYARIKQLSEIECGVLTQCIKAGTVFRKRNDVSTISNILLKVNAKLNGTNHCLQSRYDSPVLKKMDKCMVIGADVTHPSPDQQTIPSVVGVAASHDENAFCYNMCWRLQGPREEIIRHFETIIEEQLTFYKKKNGYLPTKLIYYRDGVSEGQFQQVMGVEKQSMYTACRAFGEEYQKTVKITIIVVQKRHHTRFFPGKSGISEDKRNNNVPAGTIVDTEITHPNENYFFLVSHQSIQGVAKPTKYCVLLDECNFTINDLQSLTYNLCHLFSRCNRSVSYPAPTYYAHLAAYRGRIYIEGAPSMNMDNLEREFTRRTVKPEIIQGHPMYFV